MHVLAPRLDLRQSQALVMTPQLRQAIKLLQSSNLEVAAFVEEEFERNPLLELEEHGPGGHDGDDADRLAFAREVAVAAAGAAPGDSHTAMASGVFPEDGAAPLDAEWRDLHGADGGHGPGYDGAAAQYGRGGRADFSDDTAGVEDVAASGHTLREHLGEQIRLGFPDLSGYRLRRAVRRPVALTVAEHVPRRGRAAAGPRAGRAVHLSDAPTGNASDASDAERRRRLAEVFGDPMPETTSDEREPDPRERPDDESASDTWLREQVPPHHG